MPLTPLEPGPLAGERAFEALRSAILSGELPVGTRLRIRDLARELDISTMPVREAIRRLEELGLAASEPYRGAVVRGFNEREVLDLYAVRTLLETDATVLGITSLSETDIEVLEEQLELLTAAHEQGDAVKYVQHDEEFLKVVYAAAGNAVMLELIRNLWYRCRPYKLMGVRHELELSQGLADVDVRGYPDGYSPLLDHQRQLLQAARTGDSATARQATRESLSAAMRRIRLGLLVPEEDTDEADAVNG